MSVRTTSRPGERRFVSIGLHLQKCSWRGCQGVAIHEVIIQSAGGLDRVFVCEKHFTEKALNAFADKIDRGTL